MLLSYKLERTRSVKTQFNRPCHGEEGGGGSGGMDKPFTNWFFFPGTGLSTGEKNYPC